MEELNFRLEVFEGPLDLMLALIAKHKLNIRDIEIAVLVEQFLLYLEKMQEADIEIAGEFMEMAARLIYIKTAALLPKHEVEELKKELEGALIEYAMCKQMAEKLRDIYIGNNLFVRSQAEIEADNAYHNIHETDELLGAYLTMSGRVKQAKELRSNPVKPVVAKSYISVYSKIIFVMRRLKSGKPIALETIYRGQNRSQQVATFLALLELSKYSRVSFSEDNRYIEFTGKRGKTDVNNESTGIIQ